MNEAKVSQGHRILGGGNGARTPKLSLPEGLDVPLESELAAQPRFRGNPMQGLGTMLRNLMANMPDPMVLTTGKRSRSKVSVACESNIASTTFSGLSIFCAIASRRAVLISAFSLTIRLSTAG